MFLQFIRDNYEHYKDFMVCFVMTEFLGERYANRDALEVTRALSQTPVVMPRSLAPHALEELHRHAPDEQVAAEALSLLKSMATDPNQDVRDEVETSLGRLQTRPRKNG